MSSVKAVVLLGLAVLVLTPAALVAEDKKPRDGSAANHPPVGTDYNPFQYYASKPAGGGAAQPSATQDPMNTPPMTFYVAKGDVGACGPGCSEWIVGEGRFVFGLTDKLRSVLRQTGNRKLPIFFNSPGGEARAATSLGRLLRQRGMTAGVGKTAPVACVGLQEDACNTLKKKFEGPMPARLAGYGAQCNSACVFALIGAKTREVPPGAVLGVHSVRITMTVKVFRGPAPSKAKLNAMAKARLDDVNENLRDYVEEMGIDPEMFDISVKVSPNKVRVLTRDEIARYRIDTRKSVESPWLIVGGASPVLMKTIAEAKTSPAGQYRSSMIVFTCDRGTGRTLIHGRQPDSAEDNAFLVSAVSGTQNFSFPVTGRPMKVGEMLYVTRSAFVPRDFFKVTDADASFNILEVGVSDNAQQVRKYPIQDLNKSLGDLEQTCARHASAQVQGSQQ